MDQQLLPPAQRPGTLLGAWHSLRRSVDRVAPPWRSSSPAALPPAVPAMWSAASRATPWRPAPPPPTRPHAPTAAEPALSATRAFQVLATQDVAPPSATQVRTAELLLGHAGAPHGEGLKVFYVLAEGTIMAACTKPSVSTRRSMDHATLASLLRAPDKATQRTLFKVRMKPAPAGATDPVWGGTRFVAQFSPQAPGQVTHFTLEPSVRYMFPPTTDEVLDTLARFHANMCRLGGAQAPVVAQHPSMEELAARINALLNGTGDKGYSRLT